MHFNKISGPLDVAAMSRDVPLALHDSWLRERASGERGLDYDRWLEGHLWSGAPVEQQYRQGLATFALRHRGLYKIEDPVRGARSFRCMVEQQFPFVSFIGAQGSNLPWLTVPGLFTVDELVSLRQVGGEQ
ncbi:hypothetical protein CupriaWKF_30705 [Cupriavidus sp. WKF15]|uniref:hypothetical protein n=1 Tax=Cupriavidus sp. WKF15 TaxID=3032282 RepID=UPI0023E11756|nr:hypothetical protein [Cupriavidus sp. WKF15]WER50728.1 hypothetical protein CupriaWKF_30705 [Cupriavidus sp. WKF15]